jgi:hypothetical protein
LYFKKVDKKIFAGRRRISFGSRANDKLSGGDIYILVIGEKALTSQEKINVNIAFYKKFREQKLDFVSFKKDEPSNFKELALLESVKL